MLDKNGVRQLAYIVEVAELKELPGYDRVESARVNGWWCIVPKGQFKVGSLGIYFEIDSKVPDTNPAFAFMEKRKYHVKTQKMCKSISQGLLMAPEDFGWCKGLDENSKPMIMAGSVGKMYKAGDFVTDDLGVTYYEAEDVKRKAASDPNAKYKSMMSRHPKLAKSKFGKWCMKHTWAKKFLFLLLGNKKKDISKVWPVGKFPGVSKTDQERVENMPWILKDKTPFIVTEKCDGSSATYILERIKKNKFEFYVCSRNVRMKDKDQECFYGTHNYYWEVAEKYHIEEKMRAWLNDHPEATFVCWQGEICAPGIQKNPHHLSETHFYCFHWTDSINQRRDIRDAALDWQNYEMEVVPIVGEIILPDDFEEFKSSADGVYTPLVCEGNQNCKREGFVYYKTTDPTFSFKNVSREYLLSRKE